MSDYFIKVDDGKDLRRCLLEGSKLAIQVLKQEHDMQKLRDRKMLLLTEARAQLKELTFLLNQLEDHMPSLTKKEMNELMPEHLKRKAAEAKKQKTAEKRSAKSTGKHPHKGGTHHVAMPAVDDVRTHELSKLEKLESSLSMIEDRLNKL